MTIPASIVYSKSDDLGAQFDSEMLASQFKLAFPGDLYHFDQHGSTNEPVATLVKTFAAKLATALGGRPRITSFADGVVMLRLEDRMVIEVHGSGSEDMWSDAFKTCSIAGFGDEPDVTAVRAIVQTLLCRAEGAPPTIKWHYAAHGSRTTASMVLDRPKPVFDAFYPWIEGGLTAYFNRFAASDDVVLVLLGEPGTGKTSFIRHLLWHLRWNCAVTYDPELLKRDDLFVSFLTSHEDQVMIVEDADVFLTSRTRDHNDLMARFLNISDGLFKPSTTKKLIFTGNITQLGQIDEALLREGRCFDCQMFRPLTFSEAVQAAEAAGLPVPMERRDHSLAQLFAVKKHKKVTKVGF